MDKYLFRLMLTFMVPVACAVIFTILTGLVISYITSTFMNVLLPTTPLLLAVCAISIVIFTCALVLFTCAMYLIVVVGAIIEVKARIRYHKVMQKHRKIELEKHRQELPSHSGRRITGALQQPSLRRGASRPHRTSRW